MSETLRYENYEVLQKEDGSLFELGRGGMGVTYKAWDVDLHCHVALKVIHPGILEDVGTQERFLREARAAAKLRHPNIASVFRLGRAHDDSHFYAMEFCAGPTLAQAVAARGPFPAAEALRVAWQVSKALMLAEQHQLLHRDLKPSNLILTERSDEGQVVKVIDFGLAKSLAEGHQSLGTNGFVGTAQYASPEQLEEQDLDVRSDIYALGACLWFMLTGGPIFTGALARVINQILTTGPRWEMVAGQPSEVTTLLRRLLAKDRENRPASATVLRRELEECLRRVESLPETSPAAEPATLAAAVTPSLPEVEFASRYPMSARIARDEFGRVFQARDMTRGGSTVAVRVLDAALTKPPEIHRSLETQLTAARAHPHPHLVKTLDFSTARQGLLVAVEWTAGFTLRELLQRREALRPGEMLFILTPLAAAADHADRHQFTQIDFTPERVMVHFPGGLKEGERERWCAASLQSWPEYVVKAEVLSPAHFQIAGNVPSPAPPAGGKAFHYGPRDHVTLLATLACELLGSRRGEAFTPFPNLGEPANAVLRQALGQYAAFATSSVFVEALRTAVGSESATLPRTPPPARPKPALLALPTLPAGWSWPRISQRQWLTAAAVLFVLVVAWAYRALVYLPNVREQDHRRVLAEAQAEALTERQRLTDAEAERLKDETRKAKAEAARAEAQLDAARRAALAKTLANAATPTPTPAPATPTPVPRETPSQATRIVTTVPEIFRNAVLDGQELSPSGGFRVKYLRYDNESVPLRRIVLEDVTNPDRWSILFEHRRDARVLISPDEQFLIVNNYPSSSGGGAQIYRRDASKLAPVYEVAPEFTGHGQELQDWAWRFYLNTTGRKADSDRDHVMIGASAWSPDSRSVTLRIVPSGSNRDLSVPTPWECIYDIRTQQFRSLSPSNNPAANTPAPAVTSTAPWPGERYPDTRTRFLNLQEIQSWTNERLRYAINEMFARHGADFLDKALRKYFSRFSWYHPVTGKDYDVAEKEFTPVEEQNVKLLGALRDQRAGRVPQFPPGTANTTSETPPMATPVPQDPNIAHGPRYRGGGHVYKVPDLKDLVGHRLDNAWLYGDFLFKGNNGNIGFFITTAIVLLPKEGSTQLLVEFPDGIQLSQNALNVLHDPMLVMPVHFNANDPIALRSVQRENGKLVVHAQARGALRY